MNYLDGVATLRYDTNKCIGCRKCIEVCPHAVFKMNQFKVEIINRDACIECGACQMNCPTQALEVNAGVGCASAIIYSYMKKSKWLKPFAKDF